jgi:hypothetical protein
MGCRESRKGIELIGNRWPDRFVSPSARECLDADHDHIECVAQEIVGTKDAKSDILNGRAPPGQLSRLAICFYSIAVKHLMLNEKGPCVGVK